MVNTAKKIYGYTKQLAIDALKTTSKRVIQKAAEATGNLISNKIANRITKVSRSSPQIKSEIITNRRKTKKHIDDLSLI